jgi:hypothetical protein
LVGPVRCTTYHERTMGRLQTVCSDGSRSVSTYNRTLSRWESTVTPPAGTRPERRRPHVLREKDQ